MKPCRVCGVVKPLDEFYPHRKMRDGRVNHCRTCEVERSAARQRHARSRQAPTVDGWTFDAIPTMKRRELLKWAASRYGLVDPSPDDILSARWPQYDRGDRIHISGYHRDFSEAFRLAVAHVKVRLCKVCSVDITGLNGNRRYCGPKCQESAEFMRRGTTNYKKRAAATPVTEAERYQMVTLYEAEMTLQQIAAETGRSHSAVMRALDEMGAPRRRKRGINQQEAAA